MRTLSTILFSLVLGVTVACSGGSKKPDTMSTGSGGGGGDTAKLYDRLGGKDAITKVVDMFVANVAADGRINAMFANADIPGLKTKLVDQICEATGGPCKYTGKNMKEAHASMGITEEHFNALVEDLVKALDAAGVKAADKDELLSALGTMKGDIVTK